MAKVKLVLSWSGPASREVARALRDWLPTVIQGIDPWMSEEDIQKGAQWLSALQRALAESGFGIICLTPDNLDAEWLHSHWNGSTTGPGAIKMDNIPIEIRRSLR